MISIGKYIFANEVLNTDRKTQVFTIQTNDSVLLGTVKWYGPWRKYSFYPSVGTLYEPICLRDIAAFIDKLMEERKK